jgi:hypothetical protein
MARRKQSLGFVVIPLYTLSFLKMLYLWQQPMPGRKDNGQPLIYDHDSRFGSCSSRLEIALLQA